MADYSSFDELSVKHLEMIQAVISRLGSNSFLVKGWAVTISGAFAGFAIDGKDPDLALAAALPAVIFWGLDAYFLRTERLFRALHNAVRTGDPAVEPFSMDAASAAIAASAPSTGWGATLMSPALTLLYGTLVASAILTAALV